MTRSMSFYQHYLAMAPLLTQNHHRDRKGHTNDEAGGQPHTTVGYSPQQPGLVLVEAPGVVQSTDWEGNPNPTLTPPS